MTLPDIPRLYTALAEVLAVLVYAQAAPPRAAKPVTYAVTAGWAAVLGGFLQLTGSVPLAWWLPCMVTAIAWLYLYLWGTREMNLLEAGYSCARAFILAELAASSLCSAASRSCSCWTVRISAPAKSTSVRM